MGVKLGQNCYKQTKLTANVRQTHTSLLMAKYVSLRLSHHEFTRQ